ncbi:MAG: translocation/assembly module TamB domain-containing protein [Usitatibacter sp.]
MSAEIPVDKRAEPAPKKRRGRARRWMVRSGALLLVLILVVVAGAWWLLTTTEGARFALNYAIRAAGDGVRYEGLEGALGGPMRVKLLEISRPDLYVRIDDLEMQTALRELPRRLYVHHLGARAVEVRTVDTGAAAKLPVSFAPPYAIRLDEGRVGELRLGALPREAAAQKDPSRKRAMMAAARDGDLVVKNILLRGEGDEREWRIAEMSAETTYGKASLSGRVDAGAPFALDLRAVVDGVAAQRPYKAAIAAKGTLQAIEASLDGEVSGQRATGRAALAPFAATPLRALELHAKDVDLARQASGPQTRLALDVKLAGEGKSFAGPIAIENAAPGPWDAKQLPFRSATARIAVSAESVELSGLQVSLIGGGTASGRATLRKGGVEAKLAIADVDLAALHRKLQKTRLGGNVTVSGDRAAQRFEVALKDPRFDIQGRAALANQRLEIETARVRTGGGSMVASGAMALAGARTFRFEGTASHFDPAAFVKSARGDLNFTFVASGSMADGIAGEAQALILPSTLAGMPASGKVLVAGDTRRIANADVSVAIGDARVAARGRFGAPGDVMEVSVHAPDLSLLSRPLGMALAGKLDADVRLTGTFQAPAGSVSLTGANLALPSNVYVRELRLRMEAGTAPDSPIDASLQAKGVALGEEKPPSPLAETFDATLKGTRAAHRIEADAAMTRDSRLRATLAGGFDPRAAELSWTGRIESLALTGRGAFALAAPTSLSASARRVELGDAQLRGEWGEARLAVTRWTPKSLELKGSSPGIQVQNLARSFRLGTLPRSNLVVAGDWEVRGAETFNAAVNLRRVSGDLRVGEPPLPLGLQRLELKATSNGGQAQATLEIAGDRIGRVQAEGTATIVRGASGWEIAPAAPVQAKLVAENNNLETLAAWLGPEAKLGGRLSAHITVTGTGADPRVAGEARAVDLVLREPQSGFEVEQGQVVLRMRGKSVAIERFTASTPWKPPQSAREHFAGMALPTTGTITAEGSIDLGARSGSLRIIADKAVLTQAPRRFLAVSGEARLQSGDKGLVATGSFKADAGWIGALETAPPSVAEDVIVVRAAAPAPAEAREKGEPVRVDARFSLGDHLYFEGRGLDTRLVGEVQVSGPPTALRAVGTIRTEGGTYNGYGQKLSVERGVLRFAGPVDNPRLSVLALRKGLPVEAGVEVLGTVMRPRVRLVSTPDVPEPEKLSWLVLGRGPSELAPGDASVLLAAATSLLGHNNPGSDLGKKLGLDEVRIGRANANSLLGVLPQSTVAGKTGSGSAADVVSVGKKLTRDVHLNYEQGLADAEGALKITWTITQNFQLLARAGYLPGLDAVYRWTFK